MSKPLPPSRTADQYVVRFPDGLRDYIAQSAKARNRSMNAEILLRLQYTVEVDKVNNLGFESVPHKVLDQLRPETREQITLLLEQALEPLVKQLAKERGSTPND